MVATLALLLISPTHERVHYGFVIAAGAAASGTDVLAFATNGALHGFCRDWSRLEGAARDTTLRTRGVAGLDELRDAAITLGVRLLACEAGLAGEGLRSEDLLPGVSVGGVTSFLADAGSRIITL